MATGTSVGEKHSDLAVLNAAGRPTILSGYPHRMAPLFEKPGLVDDHDPVRVPQMLDAIRPQIVPHGLGIPHGTP